MTEPKIFWEPNKENFKNIKMVGFAEQVKQHFGFDWQNSCENLWQWSINNRHNFWSLIWGSNHYRSPTKIPNRDKKTESPYLVHPLTYRQVYLTKAHSSIPTLLYSPWEKMSNSKSFKSQKFSIWGTNRCVNIVNNT